MLEGLSKYIFSIGLFLDNVFDLFLLLLILLLLCDKLKNMLPMRRKEESGKFYKLCIKIYFCLNV